MRFRTAILKINFTSEESYFPHTPSSIEKTAPWVIHPYPTRQKTSNISPRHTNYSLSMHHFCVSEPYLQILNICTWDSDAFPGKNTTQKL